MCSNSNSNINTHNIISRVLLLLLLIIISTTNNKSNSKIMYMSMMDVHVYIRHNGMCMYGTKDNRQTVRRFGDARA